MPAEILVLERPEAMARLKRNVRTRAHEKFPGIRALVT
jgi:hypothetical protein